MASPPQMPIFYYLPKVSIAAIIIVAAMNLVQLDLGMLLRVRVCKPCLQESPYLTISRRVQMRAWRDLLLTFMSLFCTFFLGPELGIVIALSTTSRCSSLVPYS